MTKHEIGGLVPLKEIFKVAKRTHTLEEFRAMLIHKKKFEPWHANEIDEVLKLIEKEFDQTKPHGEAKVIRLGYKDFECSVCHYRCYSKKWVREHIEQRIRFEVCPAPFGMFGDYNIRDEEIGKYCKECGLRVECEIEVLEQDLRYMEIMSKHFLKNPNIKPLMGIGRYAKRYEERKKRLKELLQIHGDMDE